MDLQEGFVHDEVFHIVKEAVETVLASNVYQSKKVPEWTSTIIESVLKSLQSLNKPYKYVVTCVIVQKTGAGFHLASTCFWDASTDGVCSVRWENKSMHCVVSAFGLAI